MVSPKLLKVLHTTQFPSIMVGILLAPGPKDGYDHFFHLLQDP